MRAVSLLPRACGASSIIFTFKHPRTNHDTSFLIDGSTVYEILNMDRPHSSFFLGDTVVSSGSFVVISPIHPLFLVLTFLDVRGQVPIPPSSFFADSPYSSIESILLPLLPAICTNDANGLTYDRDKAVAWIAGKCGRVSNFFKTRRPQIEDHVAIELAYDVIRHFLHRDLAASVKAFLTEKNPDAFKPKPLEQADRTDEKSPQKKRGRCRKVQVPAGTVAITTFFSPKPSPK
jgi:hypothetical protein